MTDNACTNPPSASQSELRELGKRLVHLLAKEDAAREQVSVWISAVQLALRDNGPLPPAGARAQWCAAAAELDASLTELERAMNSPER